MSESIPALPPIPPGLREAAQRGLLVPFIGAGVSRLAGCPDWPEFADRTLKALVNSGKFSFAQLDQITRLNARIKLSIARGLAAEHKVSIDFAKIIEPEDRYDGELGRKIYGSLGKIAKTFVTTNYDEWLDTEITDTTLSLSVKETQVTAPQTPAKRTVFHEVNDFTIANLNRTNSVFHIHGSLVKPEGMVVTTSEYLARYRNDRSAADPAKENRILTFLEHLFRNRTVLFVGYGLSELEILEYVIQKARVVPGEGEQTPASHFMVQGFFSHEDTLMRSLTSYYKQCDIQLIPYLKDKKDYLQLVDVLESFAATIPATEPGHLERLIEMEKLIAD